MGRFVDMSSIMKLTRMVNPSGEKKRQAPFIR